MKVYHDRLKWLEVEKESALFYMVSTKQQESFWIPKADFTEAPPEKKKEIKKEKQ